MTWDLFVHDLGRNCVERLTREQRLLPSSAAGGHAVHWSPDGQRLAFMQFPKGTTPWNSFFAVNKTTYSELPLEIWTVDATGGSPELRQLTEGFGDVVLEWR